jgi:hypothetical protein
MSEPEALPTHAVNSSFSAKLPGLQLAWDSTSLGTFKECQYKYYLSIVQGWVPRYEAVDLTFGQLYHSALERYDHLRAAGEDHEAATLVAVAWALNATWDRKRKRPWQSDDPNKNRLTLIRTVVWYLDEFGAQDECKTLLRSNGAPMVELSFSMGLGLESGATGEPFLLSGHMDRVVEFAGQTYIQDRKTTKYTLDGHFFDKFTPDNQFTLYVLASHVVLQTPAQGLIVDGAQIGVTFSRFGRGIVHRSQEILEEWMGDLTVYLAQAENAARMGHWIRNDKACNMYRGCQFRSICARSPSVREDWLAAGFVRRRWNPLEVRGDI